MKKKLVKALALSLALTSVLGGTLTANAEGLTAEGDTGQQNTEVEFVVTNDDLGGGVVVTVPAKLTLANDGSGNFANAGNVSAYGYLSDTQRLEVKAPTEIDLTNTSNANMTPKGTVTFGTDNTDYWSASELYAGTTQGGGTAAEKEFGVSAAINQEGITLGTYQGTVIFDCTIVAADTN